MSFNTNFQMVDQYTGDEWLIHGTTHRNQLKTPDSSPPAEYPGWYKFDRKESDGHMFNPIL